jgi:hypothetical protein
MPSWTGGHANPDGETTETETAAEEPTQDGEADQTNESGEPDADA